MAVRSPLDDSPAVSQVGLALSSVAFAVLFGTGLIAVTLWGVRTLQLGVGQSTPAGNWGPGGGLLIFASVGGPAIAGLAAYALMAPIKSYYRRGGLAIVASFSTVALALVTTVPTDHFIGPSGLLGLASICAVLCLLMAWLARRRAATP